MAISARMVWLLMMVVISAIGISLSQQRLLDPLENSALSITSPLQGVIRNAAENISDPFDGGSAGGAEAQALRVENERLLVELARLREQLATEADLAELGKIVEERPEDTFLSAKIIGIDPKDIREAIAIDRGTKDGIQEGMMVVGEGSALAGTITRALDNYSWVTLVTDPNSHINAVVQESDTKGVLSGRLGALPILELLPQGAPVKPGDLVVTSGLGGTFPSGLVIGRVVGVEGQLQDPFKRARVEPTAKLEELDTVLVLTSFVPAKVEGQ